MKKSEALVLAKEKYGVDFNQTNTHFSNVNSAKPVWWFEIPLSKIENNRFQVINLITEHSGGLNLLPIPIKFFRDNLSGFKIRYDKQKICLELDTRTYKNKVGSAKMDFRQFVK
jgi:hypothetical protein